MSIANEWILPIPRIDGRKPQVSNSFVLGTHDGIDFAWPWMLTDLSDPFHRSGKGHGSWAQLPNAVWIAAVDGIVLYAEPRERGWALRMRTSMGIDLCYFHGVTGSCHVRPHDVVHAGEKLALVGADPLDGEGFGHLHFEVRVPCEEGTPHRDGFGHVPTDPWKFLWNARILDLHELT